MTEEGLGQTGTQPGFEHILPENCVEYLIFLPDRNLQIREQIAQLDSLRKIALQKCRDLTKNYIWQRGVFTLEASNEKGLNFLHGLTDYGDAIEDEWLIVYILRELSRSDPRIWIRVFDNDGEFLLVEAAKVLPNWLNPEIDRNRVWINQGKLYIIPRKADELYKSPSITIPDALDFINTAPKDLVHSDLIEAEAFYRLKKYPDQVTNSLHYSLVTIPRKLALVLNEMPEAIAPAIEAFYLRDAISLKPVLSSTEALTFPPEDFVTISVRFSKVLFAQLKSQHFELPQRWRSAPTRSKVLGLANKDKIETRRETGMKLTCGFEMLVRKVEKTDSRIVRALALLLQDLEEDGPSTFPMDSEIASWKDVTRDDDESWMNIDFQDFEHELEGDRDHKSSFGDANTQDTLRTIVSRFQSFLNDDSAGVEGAELDEMDMNDDDDEDSSEDEGTETEGEIAFDEEGFSRMMKEMMGLEKESRSTTKGKSKVPPHVTAKGEIEDDQDDEAIQNLAAQFEAELKGHGALKLDSTKDRQPRIIDGSTSSNQELAEHDGDSGEDDEVDIDYNLAKNLLESFKSQAGMAGPTGNLLGMMGFQLPRDEDEGRNDKNDNDV